MSIREQSLGPARTGLRTPHRSILELVHDKEQMEILADALEIARKHIRKDECDQWTLSHGRGQVQPSGDLSSYQMYVDAYSSRKWGVIKRKAKAFGWEITQDGDDEGCFRFGVPTNADEATYLRTVLGLRRRRLPKSDGSVTYKGVSAA
jgi:hypothetical protein